MSGKMNALIALLLCGSLSIVVDAADVCRQCENGIYCIDQKDYYYCINDQPDRSEVLSCDAGKICSTGDAAEPCHTPPTDTTGPQIACKDIGTCNECDKMKYTCVSETEYARCVKDTNGIMVPGPDSISCDDGELCSLHSYQDEKPICVPSCVLDHLIYEPSCSAESSESPAGPSVPTDTCWEALKAGTVKDNPFFLRSDTTCKSYIQCELIGFEMVVTSNTCRGDLLFDLSVGACSSTYTCPAASNN